MVQGARKDLHPPAEPDRIVESFDCTCPEFVEEGSEPQ